METTTLGTSKGQGQREWFHHVTTHVTSRKNPRKPLLWETTNVSTCTDISLTFCSLENVIRL